MPRPMGDWHCSARTHKGVLLILWCRPLLRDIGSVAARGAHVRIGREVM